MFDLVLLMAGEGKRTGLSQNKVLYEVNNKPLFRYSLEKFLECEECKNVVLVVREDEKNKVINYLDDLELKKIKICFGGKERQDSVYNSLNYLSSEVVLIHDAARPLISKDIIMKVYEEVKLHQASVPAYNSIDTIKELKDGKLITLNRANLYNIQTPQGVNLKMFKEAHELARKENYYATDDVSLLEKYFGVNVKLVAGSVYNIKVTTSEDLNMIKKLLKE